MQRLPGHHRAHGRAGEPGHHDGQVEGTPPQPHPPAAQSRTLPGLRPCCSHRDAPVHRSRRCSMRLMGSRATLERRTASTRSAFPPPLTWCAGRPALPQATRDAMLGVCTCIVPCVAVAELCRRSVPPEMARLSACIHQPRKQTCVGGGWGGSPGRLVRHVHGSQPAIRCVPCETPYLHVSLTLSLEPFPEMAARG